MEEYRNNSTNSKVGTRYESKENLEAWKNINVVWDDGPNVKDWRIEPMLHEYTDHLGRKEMSFGCSVPISNARIDTTIKKFDFVYSIEDAKRDFKRLSQQLNHKYHLISLSHTQKRDYDWKPRKAFIKDLIKDEKRLFHLKQRLIKENVDINQLYSEIDFDSLNEGRES